jgi:hypothetical protein
MALRACEQRRAMSPYLLTQRYTGVRPLQRQSIASLVIFVADMSILRGCFGHDGTVVCTSLGSSRASDVELNLISF